MSDPSIIDVADLRIWQKCVFGWLAPVGDFGICTRIRNIKNHVGCRFARNIYINKKLAVSRALSYCPDMKTADAIRTLLEQSPLTVCEISRSSGLSRAWIYDARKGGFTPKPETLKTLLTAMDLSSPEIDEVLALNASERNGNKGRKPSRRKSDRLSHEFADLLFKETVKRGHEVRAEEEGLCDFFVKSVGKWIPVTARLTITDHARFLVPLMEARLRNEGKWAAMVTQFVEQEEFRYQKTFESCGVERMTVEGFLSRIKEARSGRPIGGGISDPITDPDFRKIDIS